jgi:hypothetical protein
MDKAAACLECVFGIEAVASAYGPESEAEPFLCQDTAEVEDNRPGGKPYLSGHQGSHSFAGITPTIAHFEVPVV